MRRAGVGFWWMELGCEQAHEGAMRRFRGQASSSCRDSAAIEDFATVSTGRSTADSTPLQEEL